MKRLLLFWFATHCFLSSFTQNIGTFNTYLAIAASSSGKIIAVGQSSEGYMITSIPSYSPGWSEVSAVAWQGEKFIVVGSRVMRFNQNGTTDASFANGGAVPGLSGTDIWVLCSGKVLVATGNGIVRLMPDGSFDPSFGENGQAAGSFRVIDIAIAPDGKIYALGKQNIFRFMPNGTPDPSFMQAPLPVSGIEFSKVAIQADGKPVITGSYNPLVNGDVALLRFTLDGTLDPTFNGSGWLKLDMSQRYDTGVDVSLQSDGKIIVLGTGILFQCPCPAVGNNGYILARYNSDGTLDTGFGVPTTLPIYNINPPFSLSFPGMGKTVMGSFLKATALELYGDSIYVAGGTTPANKGQGTSVFLNTFHNDGSPLNFTSNLAATIPSAYSLPQGVSANTVYRGYAPASALTLTVQLPEGNYAYEWNTGATTPSISVLPITTSNYSVTVTNAYGCMGTASTIVQVVDVRCGNGNDKGQVCQAAGSSDKVQSICIAPSAVAAHLKKGSSLGSCATVGSSVVMKGEKKVPEIYSIKVLNNPTTNYFTLDIQSPNLVNKVTISIYDAAGSLRESRILLPNSRFDLGQLYPKGVYFAQVVQGSNKRILRLVKLQ